MHSMKHNSIGIDTCPKHKHDAIQENKHKEKQTKQGFLINLMSSPPWYMHLPYGISLPLQMYMRNRISPPKNDKNTPVYSLEYTHPLFVRNRQRIKEKRGQEMKERTMIMMHEGCEMNEKMKLNPKTKQNATKHKVNMTC